jgi:hypothetical protein
VAYKRQPTTTSHVKAKVPFSPVTRFIYVSVVYTVCLFLVFNFFPDLYQAEVQNWFFRYID